MPVSRSFGGRPAEYSAWAKSRFVVVPVPYESIPAEPTGARYGPDAIIEASQRLDNEIEIYRAGIHTLAPVETVERPERMAVRVTEIIGRVLFADKVPVLLGGDHSLTFGAVCAALKLDLSNDLTVIQLDARPDLYQEYSGTRWGCRSVGRRAAALPGVKLVQVGLRSASPAEYSDVPSNVMQFWCEEMLNDFPAAIETLLQNTGDDVYLSVDMSVCDPAWMPAANAPEPGGFSYQQMLGIIQALCTQRRVLGFDCVELRDGYPEASSAAARMISAAMGWLSAK